MFYLWIALITFISTSGGVFLGILIHNYRITRKEKTKLAEKEELMETEKRHAFVDAYFELKENIESLENILNLVEEKEIKSIDSYLEKISIEKVFCLNKNFKLKKIEFKILDQLHSLIIAKRKIEFYKKLFLNKKINLLELRANITGFIEDAVKTSKYIEENYKEIFNEYPVKFSRPSKFKTEQSA